MRKIFVYVILISGSNFYGQDELALINDIPSQNCFKDCGKRLELSKDTLNTADKIRKALSDSSFNLFSLNDKIIKGLVGCKFPNTSLKTISGSTISIEKFKGKPVFINLWFTTCPPCLMEIPPINKLVKEFENKAVFLSINTDDINTLKEFLATKEFNTEHVRISKKEAFEDFCAIGGFPFNLIIDANGNVTDVWTGGNSDPKKQTDFYNRVKKGLSLLLNQKK